MGNATDHELASDWQAFRDRGDTEALARVFDHAAPRLLLVAAHLTRDSDAAEDLLQTTFLSAMKSAQAYQGRGPVMAWLTRILTHRATDLFRRVRRERRLQATGEDAEPISAKTPADRVVEQETIEHIAMAIDGMPGTYRQILTLRLVHGLRTIEIARSLGRSPDTIRSQSSRAMKLLKERLPQGIAVPAVAISLSSEILAAVRKRILTTAGAPIPVEPSRRLKLWAGSAVLATLALVYWQLGGRGEDPGGSERPQVVVERTGIPDPGLDGPRAPVVRSETPESPPTEPPGRWRIVYTDGQPARGITATAFPFNTNPRVNMPVPLVADDDGYVDTAPLSAGRYTFEWGWGENIVAVVGKAALLRVSRGITVRGRVVDRAGDGVAGAEVWLSYGPDAEYGRVVTTSDADGWFEIRDVADRFMVMARTRDLAWSARYQILGSPELNDAVRLRLSRKAVRIHGEVTDEFGSPLAGADVLAMPMMELLTPPYPDGPRTRIPGCSMTKTDSFGAYSLTNLAQGLYVFEVRHSRSDLGPMQKRVRVGREDIRGDVPLFRSWTLRGVLRDESGSPLPGILVQVPGGPLCRAWDRTDSEGKFALSGLAAGKNPVHARAPNLGQVNLTLEGQSGETKQCELVVRAGRSIRGRLVDDAGRPLANWSVNAAALSPRHGQQERVHTDEDGRFLASNLVEAEWFVLRCQPRLYADTHLTVKARPGDLGDLVIGAGHSPTARVVGQILTTKETPPTGAKVTLISHVDREEGGGAYVDAGTGRFEIRNGQVGRFDVLLTAPPRRPVVLKTVDLSPDSVEDLGTRQIDEVSKFVLHLPEEADENWQVAVVNPATGILEPRRVTQGRLEVLAGKEEVMILAQSPTWVQTTLRFRPPELGKTFHARAKFQKGTRVHLDFKFASGREPKFVRVKISDSQGQVRFSWALAALVKEFEFQFPPGKYTLWADASNGHKSEVPLVIATEPVFLEVKL